MLSILIPVYNFNIISLVNELHRQAVKADVPFEIIVLDDRSSELLRDQNKDVSKLPGVRFIELDKNIGRASIRNRLTELALYPCFLFMDCDAEIPDEQYIKRYLPYVNKQIVVCGGRIYREEQPEEPEYMLRWLYGIRREQTVAVIRNKAPYRSFMTNNFMISRDIMQQVRFDESITQYGHEDTLFGLELKKKCIPIIHVQNPLIHIGLEIASEFIRKSGEGIDNLLTLIDTGKIGRNDFSDIRLLRAYDLLRKNKQVKVYRFFYNFITQAVMRNLLGSNPSMMAFDLYKLSVLTQLIKKRQSVDSLFQ